jgi:hypothetical protein
MSMKKSLAAFLVLSFMMSSTTPLWAADPKPGGKCLRLGQIATIPGYKFKCVMVKNKLVWDKGTSTTPKASSSASPTSDPYLISPAEINSFQDAVNQYKDIKFWAWKKAMNAVGNNPTPNTDLDVLVGPHSKRR